ncbi:beta-glucosidase [Fulvivirga sp. M361]|uniref:glycoside hydrolase family 3 N-terminal domain-containing protein n=1 Tax=Fulvivirga sp. M361 TaxID=2594266 RepID=UPI00117A5F09|nr:glycoside hydrolase family 3 N-terminal domain-containing protein [Fulvivirga sp. M361]TRX50023.1 beta-glucosidase [Fulvivirga sp. M361]
MLNHFPLIVFFSGLVILLEAEAQPPKSSNETEIDHKVTELLSRMSMEEKVGQMSQVAIDVILKDNSSTQLDPQKLRKAIIEKKVGSILNVKGGAYTLDEWHNILSQIQELATKETPNSIPVLYGIDAIHGSNYIRGGTLFPHNIGMAATRNLDLAGETAHITALETRASGIRWNFDPVLGMGREPLWSRFEETFGEDVYLTSKMGAKMISAYEKDNLNKIDAVASCMKHFIGYSVPGSGKDRTPSYIPERQLREIFLPPFQAAVEAGTSTVMINSGEVNGVPVHASSYFLKTILREELGFEGLAVSDWEDIKRLHTRHKIAATLKEAVKIAVNAGVDMSMIPYDYSFYDYLVELVKEGEVDIARIDEAVGRILKLKIELGLFENAFPEKNSQDNFGEKKYTQVAKQAALESITLLKNESDVLPLSVNKKLLIAGPCANSLPALHGSWSFTWQGDDASRYPESTQTVVEAFENTYGRSNIISRSHSDFDHNDNYDTQGLLEDAALVDAIVLCLGENAYAESPGGIDDLTLDDRQLELAKAAEKTGKPIVLILLQGRPRVIASIEEKMDAILYGYRPGSQGASALVEVVTGRFNPAGRLPFTYPRATGDVLLYDHKFSETISEDIPNLFGKDAYRPQWTFGHGLSYSTFNYSDLKLNKEFIQSENDTIRASVKVTNAGKVGGHHTVELYLRDQYASVTPSNKKLKRFKKIYLEPNATEEVTFSLTKKDLSFVGLNNEWVTEPGEFEVLIADLSSTFNYQE